LSGNPYFIYKKESKTMNISVIITGLIILAIFIVPFYLISRNSKKKGNEGDQPSAKAH